MHAGVVSGVHEATRCFWWLWTPPSETSPKRWSASPSLGKCLLQDGVPGQVPSLIALLMRVKSW